MGTFAAPSTVSTKRVWAGRVLSALGALFLVFDGIIHILKITPVVEAFAQLGYPLGSARALGVIEIISVALYLLPRTSVLGAILLTGYLGGAIATLVRVVALLLSTTLFLIYVALFVWVGLFFRVDHVGVLISLRC